LSRNIIKGNKNATDFPEPVGAKAIISLLLTPIGTAYIWIGIGVLNSSSSIFYKISTGNSLISAHSRMGGGQ